MRIKWFSIVRIVAMSMVLVYHFFRDLLPAGFFGVDVFFTLSGYLTTALMVEEFRRSGGFKCLAYYKRRFMRVFPPLLLSLLFTLPFALLISPDFTGGIARQAAGALGFVTNYLEILGGGSYEAQLLPHLYIHTWSLALEMQYYILWGLVCLAAVFAVWGLVKNEKKRLPALRLAMGALALILAGLCWWNMRRLFAAGADDPSAAYFASTSRCFPFFIGSAAGALLGMQLPKKIAERLRGTIPLIASIAGMALSVGGLVTMGLLFSFNDGRTYRYGFALASLLAVAFIYAARALHEATHKIKSEPRALGFFADTSYGVYLFHWPLYIVFGQLVTRNWLASLLTLALSLALASMVYYGIEPLLRGKRPWKKRPTLKAVYPAIAALGIVCLAGSALVFWRAPAINNLELPIMIGNVYQDANSVADLHARAAAIQAEPVIDRAKPPSWSDAVSNPSVADGDWLPIVNIGAIPGGVSFLGDSVALGADRLLNQTVPDIHTDSKVSRSLGAGRELLREWRADGSLREYVVISLGTNDGINGSWKAHIDGMLAELPAGCRVVFVTPYLGNAQKGYAYKEIGAYYRELEQTHPYVTVADWAAAAGANQDLLASDKIHLNGKRAMQLFVDTVLQGIAQAREKPGKGEA